MEQPTTSPSKEEDWVEVRIPLIDYEVFAQDDWVVLWKYNAKTKQEIEWLYKQIRILKQDG